MICEFLCGLGASFSLCRYRVKYVKGLCEYYVDLRIVKWNWI